MNPPPDIALFFGRFHPVLVHLPIGLIVLLAFLEAISRWPKFKGANSNSGLLLALAAPLSIGTAVCGWLLSLGGGYDNNLLRLHMWTGIGTAAICLIAALLYSLDLKSPYRAVLYLGFVCLAVSSHFGGSLTHGRDYLVRYAPWSRSSALASSKQAPASAAQQPSKPSDQPAFASLVLPILEDKCFACHGPDKSKGGLRLDSFEAILKGGEAGPAIKPGQSADSELVKRLLLPIDHDDHMPPDGKPQPSPEEIALLKAWIDSGASKDAPIASLKSTPEIARALGGHLPAHQESSAPTAPPTPQLATPEPRDRISAVASNLSAELDVPITFLSQSEPWLEANASFRAAKFGDSELAKLRPLATNLKWLDLSGTALTDAGLHALAPMVNLVKLNLSRTAVTDEGLTGLAGLTNLTYLNLYSTPVTDVGLEHLRKLPQLRQLYLWQSKVTPEGAKAFTDAMTDKAQLKAWESQIEELKKKIRDHQMLVDIGTQSSNAASAPVLAASSKSPINNECPVSGKPVDPTKTALHGSKIVAFCCDDCKARFEKDPQPFLEKLGLAATSPINKECPVSGKPVDPTKTALHGGKTVAFCCDDCKARFEKDPQPFLEKLGLTSKPAKAE